MQPSNTTTEATRQKIIYSPLAVAVKRCHHAREAFNNGGFGRTEGYHNIKSTNVTWQVAIPVLLIIET
jgi:hypothetical protein